MLRSIGIGADVFNGDNAAASLAVMAIRTKWGINAVGKPEYQSDPSLTVIRQPHQSIQIIPLLLYRIQLILNANRVLGPTVGFPPIPVRA